MKSDAKKTLKKVRQVGNSMGVILPKKMLDGVADVNAIVQIVRLGQYIVITPVLSQLELSERQIEEALQELGYGPPKLLAVG